MGALGAEEVCQRSGTPLQDFYALEQHLLSLHETEQLLITERRKNRSEVRMSYSHNGPLCVYQVVCAAAWLQESIPGYLLIWVLCKRIVMGVCAVVRHAS